MTKKLNHAKEKRAQLTVKNDVTNVNQLKSHKLMNKKQI